MRGGMWDCGWMGSDVGPSGPRGLTGFIAIPVVGIIIQRKSKGSIGRRSLPAQAAIP